MAITSAFKFLASTAALASTNETVVAGASLAAKVAQLKHMHQNWIDQNQFTKFLFHIRIDSYPNQKYQQLR